MGRRGPKEQTLTVKRAKGNVQPARLKYEEPELPAATSIDAPEGLTGPGLEEWRRIAPILKTAGVFRETDRIALEDYCLVLTELRAFEVAARAETPREAIMSGLQGAVLKLRAQANALRRELGLTPNSRGALRVMDAPEVKVDPKVQKYLKVMPGGKKF